MTGFFYVLLMWLFSAPLSKPSFGENTIPSQNSSKTDKTNIVLVVFDTCRADALGCYGNPLIKTPATDKLARNSHQYQSIFCQAPLTAPSHASLFTGLYPAGHGSRYNGMPTRKEVPHLAEILAQHGYNTAAFVSSAAVQGALTGLNRGFMLYDDLFHLSFLPQRIFQTLPFHLFGKCISFRIPERPARLTNQRAQAYMDELFSHGPFFLWVHYYDSHIPYQPKFPYNKMYDPDYNGTVNADIATIIGLHSQKISLSERDHDHIKSLYYGEVSAVDRAFENLINDLSSRGPATIILTADHGESLGEHNYFYYHGEKLYDVSLHVPLLIQRPTMKTSLPIISKEGLILDLFATIQTLADIPAGTKTNNSISLLNHKAAEHGTTSNTSIAENGNLFFLKATLNTVSLENKSYAVRKGARKYILHPDGTEELYDLLTDPAENMEITVSEEDRTMYRKVISQYIGINDVPKEMTLDPTTKKQLEQLGYIRQDEADGTD